MLRHTEPASYSFFIKKTKNKLRTLYRLKKICSTVPAVFYVLNFQCLLEVMKYYLGLIHATYAEHIQTK